MRQHAPCGSWLSPITADALTRGLISLSEPRVGRTGLWWLEGRPAERGRVVLMRRDRDGTVREALPESAYVRTRVHEYGGGAWTERDGVIFYVDLPSQRIFRKDPGRPALPITPEPPSPAAFRYADLGVAPDGELIICVRERHESGHPVINDVVLVRTDGRGEPRTLISGHDFFSSPRISADSRRLLWLSWDHPRMPWDGTELWIAGLGGDSTRGDPRRIAGGDAECVFQPTWGSSGEVYFVSDRTGWGNLYRWAPGADDADPLLPMPAEFGLPQWVFGLSRYGLLDGDRIVAVSTRDGQDEVRILDTRAGSHDRWDVGCTSIGYLTTDGHEQVTLIGGRPDRAPELSIARAGERPSSVRSTLDLELDPGYLSRPAHFDFDTPGEGKAHAFFYPPAHPDFEPSRGEKPPLIVTSHGGPTAAASSVLNLGIQYWTSRGLAVVDVNYRGSTGYGRDYMAALRGRWGELDVADCVAAAVQLSASGQADRTRMAIRGKSASGLTALCALVFHEVFQAGASYYGVADLEGLVRETHKFESRYLDTLIGPYPEMRSVYRSRSPLENAGELATPVIFFQGLEDRVVPPSQAEALIGVLREKGLPYAYLSFGGEQHGFRQASTVRRALEAELFFYSKVLGFDVADAIEPVVIENLS